MGKGRLSFVLFPVQLCNKSYVKRIKIEFCRGSQKRSINKVQLLSLTIAIDATFLTD